MSTRIIKHLPLHDEASCITNLNARAGRTRTTRPQHLFDFAVGFGTAAILAGALWFALH